MELLFLGLAAMFCSPLLNKKDEKPPEPPKDSGDRVIVVVIDKDGKPKAKEDK
ncbi:MAG TPA: hypothetical protein V6C84_10325 [Coleofasciculaceae cyanobacterium]|jgi:hypothetical protein